MIQQKLDRGLCGSYAKRHVYELHVKNVDRKVMGKTSESEVTIFFKLQDSWEELSMAQDLQDPDKIRLAR